MGSETLQCDRMARLIAQRLAIINTCKIRQIAYFLPKLVAYLINTN